jgi:hypothetical protein
MVFFSVAVLYKVILQGYLTASINTSICVAFSSEWSRAITSLVHVITYSYPIDKAVTDIARQIIYSLGDTGRVLFFIPSSSQLSKLSTSGSQLQARTKNGIHDEVDGLNIILHDLDDTAAYDAIAIRDHDTRISGLRAIMM